MFTNDSEISIVYVVLLALTGFLFLFNGYATFRVTVFLGGAYAGVLLTIIIINASNTSGGIIPDSSKDVAHFILVTIGAILGGSFGLFIYKVGFTMVGSMLGFLIACTVLAIEPLADALSASLARIGFILTLTIIFGVWILYNEASILIVATSTIGSFSIFLALDYWVRSVFGSLIYNAIYGVKLTGPVDVTTVLMIIGFVLTAVIGIHLQFKELKSRN